VYPVSAAYLEQIRADERRVYGRCTVDFTAPFVDQSIQVTANELANVSYPAQTADGLAEASYKYASLDGSTVLDGTYHPAPSAAEAATAQMGWWGSQLAAADGTFVSPFPTLTITHAARPIWSLSVSSDSKRGEWPVDFVIRLYDAANTLLHTENVTGNTLMAWTKEITAVVDVARQELEIRRWSHPGRQAKILEFFTSIQETYDGEQIVSLSLLEEREVGQAALPVGNISANELELHLQNIDHRFDAGNPASPLRGLLKPNRRVRAWLGVADSFTVQDDVTAGTLDNVVALPDGRLELASVPGPAFSRASDAYRSEGSLVPPGTPRFETGRFGVPGAQIVEEGTTNLAPNSSFKSGLVGWLVQVDSGNTVVADSTNGYDDSYSARMTKSAGVICWLFEEVARWQEVKLQTASFRVKGTVGARVRARLHNYSGGAGSVYGPTLTLDGSWQLYVLSQDREAGSYRLIIELIDNGTCYVDCVQIERKLYSTTWTLAGTRSPETLTLPTAGVLSPTAGTVEQYVRLLRSPGVNEQFIFDGAGAANQNLQVLIATNGLPTLRYGTGTATVEIQGATAWVRDTWYPIAWCWSSAGVALLVNGTVVASSATAPSLVFGENAYLGSRADSTLQLGGLIDDTRISNRDRTGAEIAAGVASNAPLPVDANTTYLLRFDGHLPTRIYRPTGQRVSPVYDISSAARPLSILVNWQESVPTGTSFTMEANVSTDGGTTWRGWQSILNGGALPVSDLTNARLQLRQTFATNADMTATAGIEDTAVTVTIDQAGEMVPLGTFWTGDWHTNEREGYVKTTARDRMELLRTSTYSASQVAVNTTLYNLAVAVLQDAGLAAAEYLVDTELQGYAIPYAWFDPQSHREALRKIAEACLGQVYCDRDGRVVVEGPSALARQGAFLLPSFPALVASENITADRFFTRSQPLRWGEVANYIEVDTQPLRPDVVTEVHRSNEPVPIAAGQTLTLTVYYNHVPSIEAVASLVDAPAGATITSATYYAWGADVSVYSPTAGTFILVINARPMKVLNKERAIAQDAASIREHGVLKYTFPGNPLVQTLTMAQRIADTLLRFYRNPRRDVEVDWRGNPALTLGDVVVVPDFDAKPHYYLVRQALDFAGALQGNLSGRKVV